VTDLTALDAEVVEPPDPAHELLERLAAERDVVESRVPRVRAATTAVGEVVHCEVRLRPHRDRVLVGRLLEEHGPQDRCGVEQPGVPGCAAIEVADRGVRCA
jgi:hypothetical protein